MSRSTTIWAKTQHRHCDFGVAFGPGSTAECAGWTDNCLPAPPACRSWGKPFRFRATDSGSSASAWRFTGLIVFAELATLVIELTRNPELLAGLREEVWATVPAGAVGAEQLMGMPRLSRLILETKRLTPIIPAIFGKARRTFVWRGFTVPEGWMVLWDVSGSNRDASTYTQPSRFDPDRFGPGREEHKRHLHAYTPQGGGPPTGHRCAGVDYSTLLMGMFLVVLLRDYEWRLPPQDLELSYRLTPPEPKDGLKAVVSRLTHR